VEFQHQIAKNPMRMRSDTGDADIKGLGNADGEFAGPIARDQVVQIDNNVLIIEMLRNGRDTAMEVLSVSASQRTLMLVNPRPVH
jgi:hypothetical protein